MTTNPRSLLLQRKISAEHFAKARLPVRSMSPARRTRAARIALGVCGLAALYLADVPLAAAQLVPALCGPVPANANVLFVPAGGAPYNVPLVANAFVVGTSGPDDIRGNPVGQTICGLGGDDTIVGGAGVDTILGGAGDDTIEGMEGGDVIEGNNGDDHLYGDDMAGTAVFFGNDHLAGGTGDDFLFGGSGADTLIGNAGNDDLIGANGDDTIEGNEGQDNLYGGLDDDELDGGADADTLVGDDGDDVLFGRGGEDVLFGGDDDDLLFGGNEDDQLFGSDGGPSGGFDQGDGGAGLDECTDVDVPTSC